jgi:hypothetical protein
MLFSTNNTAFDLLNSWKLWLLKEDLLKIGHINVLSLQGENLMGTCSFPRIDVQLKEIRGQFTRPQPLCVYTVYLLYILYICRGTNTCFSGVFTQNLSTILYLIHSLCKYPYLNSLFHKTRFKCSHFTKLCWLWHYLAWRKFYCFRKRFFKAWLLWTNAEMIMTVEASTPVGTSSSRFIDPVTILFWILRQCPYCASIWQTSLYSHQQCTRIVPLPPISLPKGIFLLLIKTWGNIIVMLICISLWSMMLSTSNMCNSLTTKWIMLFTHYCYLFWVAI